MIANNLPITIVLLVISTQRIFQAWVFYVFCSFFRSFCENKKMWWREQKIMQKISLTRLWWVFSFSLHLSLLGFCFWLQRKLPMNNKQQQAEVFLRTFFCFSSLLFKKNGSSGEKHRKTACGWNYARMKMTQANWIRNYFVLWARFLLKWSSLIGKCSEVRLTPG